MKKELRSTDAKRRERVVRVVVDSVEVAGTLRVGDRALRIGMIRPFPGLETSIPRSSLRSIHGSSEEISLAALALLYKKALFYLDHREELERLHDTVLEKLTPQAVNREKERWVIRLEQWKTLLRKNSRDPEANRDRYERFFKQLRQRMVRRFSVLDATRNKLSKKVLGGVLTVEDVGKLRTHFNRKNGGRTR